MSENIINWIDMYGREFSVLLSDLQRNYEQTTRPTQKYYRTQELQQLFRITYHDAISSGLDVVDAIAKAMKAVALAGKYDEAMKQSVEARLNAEFPE